MNIFADCNSMKFRIYIFLLLTIFPFVGSFAQLNEEFCNEIDDKKLLKNFDKAISLLIAGKDSDAEMALAKIVDEEPEFTEAWAAIAEINYSRYSAAIDRKSKDKYYSNYVKSLERIVSTCPQYNNWSVNYIIGKILFERDDYADSKKYLETYIKNAAKSDKNYLDAENTLDYINNYLDLVFNPVPFTPVIVEGVSTINDDFLPIISPDGSLAFFTHAYMKKDISSATSDKYTEEFTVARALDESGVRFSPGQALPYPFNTGKNQGASSITIDNSTLYITICEFVNKNYDNCDIYMSTKKKYWVVGAFKSWTQYQWIEFMGISAFNIC